MIVEHVDPAKEADRIKNLHKDMQLNAVDGEIFQTLFLAELKAQDPLDPMKNADFLTQLAQFSSLEQLQALNNKMESLTQNNSIGDAQSLIGKQVSGLNSDTGTSVYGVVDSVKVESGMIYLNIGMDRLKMNDIISVRLPGETQNTNNKEA